MSAAQRLVRPAAGLDFQGDARSPHPLRLSSRPADRGRRRRGAEGLQQAARRQEICSGEESRQGRVGGLCHDLSAHQPRIPEDIGAAMKRIDDCEGSLTFTRRRLLGASAALTSAAWPGLAAGAPPAQPRLLVILLLGGMDGLFAMPPVGDDELPDLRKNLAPENLQDLDGFFALHDTLQNVHQAYVDGNALLVHAASLPYTGRSHFEGQDIMESGV